MRHPWTAVICGLEGSTVATFVLVHGGFSGGWLWAPVRPLLQAAGHEVFTPTLTGVGERAHLASPEIDLDTHVQDIVAVLEYEELRDVILVGHSSSTMVVAGVAERVPERLARLVFIDTLIPGDGQSWADLLGPELWPRLLEAARVYGDGWRVPFPAAAPRMSPHPLRSVTQPLAVRNPAAAAVPRAYIYCTDKPPEWFFGLLGPRIAQAAAEARAAGWHYRELPTGHTPMQTMPQELAALFSELG